MEKENQKLKKDLKEIEIFVRDFFKKMGFEIEIEKEDFNQDVLQLSLKAKEPQLLIGGGGRTLIEIQKVLGKILRKKIGQFFLDLDINQYKKNKTEYLKDLAKSTADQVSLSKKEKVLPPMPPSERRIIHLALIGREDVLSESQGQEPKRRVVIKPK